jgi:uncharacterized membrane protein YccC
MASRWARSRLRIRFRLRPLLWWVSPSSPTSGSAAAARMRAATAQITRLTVAAVLAYLVATAVSPGILDLTAPLTALLVVQASTVGTLRMGLVRVGAVLTGVLVAVVLASYFGLSWWSLALAIATALILAKVLRLGEQSLEAPISAMLILAVTTPQLAAEVRVVNTLIGTAVGIGFTLLAPVSIPHQRAADAVRRVARSQAALLDEVATTLGDRAPHPEESAAWSGWINSIAQDIQEAMTEVEAIQESRLLNPRALLVGRDVHSGLRSAIDRLERCLAGERALLTMIAREAPTEDEAADAAGGELRRAFAVVLDDLANALRAFGDLVTASYGPQHADQVEEAMSRAIGFVRETRAVLTELMFLDIAPGHRVDVWLLQGSVLAAVDSILQQLDLERPEQL